MSATVHEGQRESLPAPGSAGSDRRTGQVLLTAGASLTGAVVGYALVASSVLPGGLTLLLVASATLLVPTSDSVSRRASLAGALVLGWTPLLWWFQWPFDVVHGAVVAAVVGGVLAGCATRPAGARWWPRLRPVDLVPLAAAAAAWLMMTRWRIAATPKPALDLLLQGYDNVAHFSMFEMLRRTGVMADQAPAPADGSTWHYGPYPQGFHAVAATFADLAGVSRTGGAAALPAYTAAVGIVVIVGVWGLGATLCSLPVLRRNPAIAVPVVALVTGVLLVGPGGSTIADGFAPFWYAVVLTAIAVSLSLACVRAAMPLQLAAMCGAIVGVAQAWAPLCLLAVPVLLCVVLPARSSRWSASRTQWSLVLGVLILTMVGVGRPAMLLLSTVGVGDVVDAAGGFSPPDPTGLILVIAAAVATTSLFPLVGRRLTGARYAPLARRAGRLGLVVATGVVSAGLLVAAQVARSGKPDYYFFKYVVGVELVLVVVVGLDAAVVLTSLKALRGRFAVSWVVALTGLAILPFALSPSLTRPALLDEARISTVHYPDGTSRSALADVLLAASARASDNPEPQLLIAIPPGSTAQEAYPNSWLMALTGSWTNGKDRLAAPLLTYVNNPSKAAVVAGKALVRDPHVVVLVPPGDLSLVRAGLADEALRKRVLTWDAAEP